MMCARCFEMKPLCFMRLNYTNLGHSSRGSFLMPLACAVLNALLIFCMSRTIMVYRDGVARISSFLVSVSQWDWDLCVSVAWTTVLVLTVEPFVMAWLAYSHQVRIMAFGTYIVLALWVLLLSQSNDVFATFRSSLWFLFAVVTKLSLAILFAHSRRRRMALGRS
jgi:hypothetical protein